MTTVVFVLAPQVHLLDVSGPAQVFSGLADLGVPWRLVFVADTEVVQSRQGMPLGASTEWPQLDPGDLVVVPGWSGASLPRSRKFSARLLDHIAEHYRGGGTVMSVCAGADALGRAGVLDGHRCTTHHELQDELARRYTKARVERDVLFVDDGRVLTSAGIASGIDLALHVVAKRYGPLLAARLARSLVVYARRNGDEPQQSVMLSHRLHVDDIVHRAQDVVDAGFAEPIPLSVLAASLGVSERTLTRAFVAATGLTPLRYQQLLRSERAEELLCSGATMEAAAHAVGLSDARMLRRMRARS
jgi:transcriptional regulator GlxA family with amidase domain